MSARTSLARLAEKLLSARGRWLALFVLAVSLVLCWDGAYLLGEGVGIYDWRKELHYHHYLIASLREFGQLPLSFVAVPVGIAWYPVLTQTSSYWGNPEVLVLSPLLPAAPWLSAVAFVKASLAFHLVVAAAGVFLLASRLRIGPVGGLVLALLTAGNPWVMQHQAIGYTPWMAAGYVPLIAGLVLGPARRWHLAAASALAALAVYQGALHVYLWLAEGMLALAVARSLRTMNARPLRVTLQVLAGSAVLAVPRLVAIARAVGGMVRAPASSYGTLGDLMGLLTDATSPLYPGNPFQHTHGTMFYDASFYTGWWLLALVALLLLAHPFLRPAPGRSPAPTFELLSAATLFLVLGWQGVWARVVDLLPLTSGQNYPYRFLPVAGFLFIVWVVCEAHAWLSALLGRRGAWLLPLALLPTLVAFHSRNAAFVATAGSAPDTLRDFRLGAFFAENVTVPGVPASSVEARPTGVRIALGPGGTEPLFLPWIRTDRQRDSFEFRGATAGRLDVGHGLYVSPVPGARVVEVRARDYDWLPLAVLAAVLSAVWWRCSPRGP